MAYAVPVEEIRGAVDDGFFFMKIKIGQPGTQAEMLEKDKARLTAIHAAIGGARTPWTANGKLPYYFDANGRYESKDTLLRLLDHARAIGAFDQIALIEEPFPEELEIDIRRVVWRRVVDMNDRALRQITASLGGVSNGFPRETGFDITPASEIMATLCLAEDEADLLEELDNIREGSRLSCQLTFTDELDGLELEIAPEE